MVRNVWKFLLPKQLTQLACLALVCLALAHIVHAQEDVKPAEESKKQAATKADTPASPEFLKALQDRLMKVATVQAGFTQTKQLAVFEHEVTIRGRFALEKPMKMIWIVDAPVRYAVRLEGEEIRQWDQDTDNVQTIHLGGDAAFKTVNEQIQAWFLGDYSVLTETFEVKIRSQEPLVLAFTPKPEGLAGKLLEEVELTFASEHLYIASVVVKEAGGDVTTLRFTQTRINEPVPKEAWDIPPKPASPDSASQAPSEDKAP